MKKQLLLFAFSAIALTSCEDDNIQGYEIDMLKGDWKTTKTEIISGKDNKTVLSSNVPSGCSAKNNTYFSTDYSTSYTYYIGTGADCQLSGTNSGTYTYSTDTKELTITSADQSAARYKVIILSRTELRLMQLFGNVDVNGDQVADVTYVSYKR
jgi:hypothetical protein